MKNCVIILIGTLCFLLASCGFKSDEMPLKGDLVVFTAEGENSDEVLVGVKSKTTGEVLVPPGDYTAVEVDGYVITCVRPDEYLEAYTIDGFPIGGCLYCRFSSQHQNQSFYYVGLADDEETEVYYFPESADKSTICVSCKYSYLAQTKLWMKTDDDVWEIVGYDGTKFWEFPTTASAIKSLSSDETVIVVPQSDGKEEEYVVYDTVGLELKRLKAYKWLELQKKMDVLFEVGGLKFYSLKSIDIDKL